MKTSEEEVEEVEHYILSAFCSARTRFGAGQVPVTLLTGGGGGGETGSEPQSPSFHRRVPRCGGRPPASRTPGPRGVRGDVPATAAVCPQTRRSSDRVQSRAHNGNIATANVSLAGW